MKYIYVAGPLYGSGTPDQNVKNVLRIAEEINRYDAGDAFVPFVPHLYFFWHFWHAYPTDYWLRMDKAWLEKCDAMICLEGESLGTALEKRWAKEAGIPVHPLKLGLGQIEKVLRRIELGEDPVDPAEEPPDLGMLAQMVEE